LVFQRVFAIYWQILAENIALPGLIINTNYHSCRSSCIYGTCFILIALCVKTIIVYLFGVQVNLPVYFASSF